MLLTRHKIEEGPRWALDGRFLPKGFGLSLLLELSGAAIGAMLRALPAGEAADGLLLAPVEPVHEVWASGVTYLRSREARRAESSVGSIYGKVYEAFRPEIFFKAIGWRVVGHNMPVRVRRDSAWNVPEPELVLVINAHQEIVGYCTGNDMSSRDIEGENPLYLPQAKIYDGSCALGPGIVLVEPHELTDVPVQMEILREGTVLFRCETRTSRMKRSFEELVMALGRELAFPQGVFLMTGTGIVPPDDVSLKPGDIVRISIASLVLENPVER